MLWWEFWSLRKLHKLSQKQGTLEIPCILTTCIAVQVKGKMWSKVMCENLACVYSFLRWFLQVFFGPVAIPASKWWQSLLKSRSDIYINLFQNFCCKHNKLYKHVYSASCIALLSNVCKYLPSSLFIGLRSQ